MQSLAPRQVIIVEDDYEMRRELVKYLNNEGYEVVSAGSALEFYRLIDHFACQLAILDIGLPDQSGVVLVEYLKKNTDIYIVMLINSDSVENRLSYYESGADGLIVKSFDFREISALISNVFDRIAKNADRQSLDKKSSETELIKRGVSAKDNVSWRLVSDGWVLISPRGESVDLTLREFKFLIKLSGAPEIAVSRKELLEALEYQNDDYGNRALESLVHRLRSKAMVVGGVPIKTAHGLGYSFVAPVNIL